MTDYSQMHSDMGQYFRSLPKNVQESIMQSGVVFHTQADMQRVVEYLHAQPPSALQ